MAKKHMGKRMKRTAEGDLINQAGVRFTQEDKKRLNAAVTRANRKREKMLKEFSELERSPGGKKSGDTYGTLHTMGKESDFIITKKNRSLQRFDSREQFEKHLEYLDRVNSKEYLDDKTNLYKENYIKALKNVFDDDPDAKEVIDKIRAMDPKDYREMVMKDELKEISYVYDPLEKKAKLNQIRDTFGFEPSEDPMIQKR